MSASATKKLQELVVRYGKVGVGVHLTLSCCSIAGCYTAVSQNLPVDRILQQVGLSSASADDQGAGTSAATAGGTFVAAMVLHKAIMPLRIPVTLVVTPVVARILQRMSLL
eukprot:TRINITY_DN51111_c0_g1_i2.p2 TRINITY_DN51111_c0_g1~~TRINITY_DN51111_c0_g1_i2.p2  ORF type:complete len:111 (+),score=14.51 TRINITY_DN51111_c0_g1_i2:78-410(+)